MPGIGIIRKLNSIRMTIINIENVIAIILNKMDLIVKLELIFITPLI